MLYKNTQEFAKNLPEKGRILGLDLGEKFIGVAVSDSMRLLASPRPPLQHTGKWSQTQEKLEAIIEEEGIIALVIGRPLNMDGSQSQAADKVESLAHKLAHESNLPTLLWDERLSTSAAESALFEHRTGRQTRASKKEIKAKLDSAAASLILDAALRAIKII